MLAADSSPSLHLEMSNGIAELTLYRPPLNVLNLELLARLNAALDQCASEAVRVVLIRSGLDRAFSAGVDIEDHSSDRLPAMLAEVRDQARRLLSLEAVTIAAIHGTTLGGGAELALLCDQVIAADDARFGFPEIALGAFPPIAAAILPERCAWSGVTGLFLGETMSAQTVRDLGLVSEVVPRAAHHDTARARARAASGFSGVALRALIRASRGVRAAGLLERVDSAIEAYRALVAPSQDAQEGIDAFLQKRAPVWSHR